MRYFVEIACVIAEVWLIHIFLSSVFQKGNTPTWIILGLYAVISTGIAVLSLLEKMAFIRIAFTFAAILLLSVIIFRVRIFHGLLAALVVCALVAVTDVMTTLLLTACGMDINILMLSGFARNIYLIACHLVFFGAIMCTIFLNQMSQRSISLRVLLPTLPCWIVSILLCVLLSWQIVIENAEIHPMYIAVLLGLLYTNLIMIYFANKVTAQSREKHALELAEHHYAMQQEYYEQFRIQQEETRALWHDISKYLRAAQAEGSSGALSQVQQMLDSMVCVIDVNNRVVSVILNDYAQSAKNAEVELELDVQVPSELFVTAADLYVLIGNTMDNALEACEDIPKDQRKITLKLKVHNSILFYEISNPYSNSHLDRIRGNYHGYGLQNVHRCVDKYHGTLTVQKQHNLFTVIAHLNSI